MKYCVVCNAPIGNHHNKRYCSTRCRGEWNRKYAHQNEHTCSECGALFNRGDWYTRDTMVCSKKCQVALFNRRGIERRREFSAQSDSRNQMNLRAFLNEVRGPKCQICAWDRSQPDMAHIVAKKDGGKWHPSNVVFLCPNHHRLFDRNQLTTEEVSAIEDSMFTFGFTICLRKELECK